MAGAIAHGLLDRFGLSANEITYDWLSRTGCPAEPAEVIAAISNWLAGGHEPPGNDHAQPEQPEQPEPKDKLPTPIRVARRIGDLHPIASDADGDVFLKVSGVAQHVRGPEVHRLIARWLLKTNSVPRADVVTQIAECIGASAREICAPAVRVANGDGALWLDCGERFARIDAAGWTLHAQTPVWFRRPVGWRPLPIPVAGGSLSELRDLIGLDGDTWTLTVAWLMAALRASGPYPVLGLVGEQDTGKSTRAELVRSLIDPNDLALDTEPRSRDDMIVGAAAAHVYALDNVSKLPAWAADTICQIATGGGIRKRANYADKDVAIVSACRPVVITGIGESERGDLASRTWRVELPVLRSRRGIAAMRAQLAAAGPRILGAMLDAAACAMRRLPEIPLPQDRMADAIAWATAAEPAIGLPNGTVVAALLRAADSGAEARAEGSPWANLLDALVSRGAWDATPANVLARMRAALAADSEQKIAPARWELPRTPHALSMALRREAPDLRRLGFVIDLERHVGRGAEKARAWYFSTAEIEERKAAEALIS